MSFKKELSGSAMLELNTYSLRNELFFNEYVNNFIEPSEAALSPILPWSKIYRVSLISISKPKTEFIPDGSDFLYL